MGRESTWSKSRKVKSVFGALTMLVTTVTSAPAAAAMPRINSKAPSAANAPAIMEK